MRRLIIPALLGVGLLTLGLLDVPGAFAYAYVTGAAAVVAMVRRNRVIGRLGLALAASLVIFAVADLLTALAHPLTEVVYLSGYALLAGAALRCLRLVGSRQLWEGLVDALVLGTVLLGLLYEPMAATAGGAIGASAAYFLATAALTAIWMRLVLTRPTATVARILTCVALLAGLVSTTVTVTVGPLPELLGQLINGSARWALAIGITHSSFTQLLERGPSDRERDTVGRMMVMTVVLVGASFAASIRGAAGLEGAARLLVLAPAALSLVIVRRVITSTRDHVLAQARLRHAATLDPLTGLRNEVGLLAELSARADVPDTHLVLIVVTGLRELLREVPTDIGDELVAALRGRFSCELVRRDEAARCDTDEFAVVTDRDPQQLADQLVARMARPLTLEQSAVAMTPSIRAGWAPVAAVPSSTIANARYAAGQADPNGPAVGFDDRLAAAHVRQRQLLAALPTAIQSGHIINHYQPIAKLESGEIVGFEALARWTDPELGRVGPIEFIPLAESSGAIIALGTRLLREACEQVATWRRELGREDLYITVNVSARQLEDDGFPAIVTGALRAADLAPSALTLELTESVLLRDGADDAATSLAAVRNLGVRLAVDDFGTGYSSLAYLQRFRPDVVKVDRAFTRELQSDAGDVASGVFAMLEQLGWPVVAEGIEQLEVVDALRLLSCELGQGYFLSPPLPVDGIDALLRDGLPDLRSANSEIVATSATPRLATLKISGDETTISGLVTPAKVIDATTTCSDVERLFRRDPKLELIVVRHDDGRLSTASANSVLTALAGQFAYGRALNGNRPISELANEPVRPVASDLSYVDAVAVALSRPDAERYHDVVVTGARVGLLSVGRLLEALAESLSDQASRDPLTGIPNRRHLVHSLDVLVEAGTSFGLLMIDLDEFKPVNDQHGHAAGDLVLTAIARRLRSCARSRDIVARLGGDEFAILVDGDEQATRRLADRCASVLRDPIEVGDETVRVGGSIGTAWGTWDSADAALAQADREMYVAKRAGGGLLPAATDGRVTTPTV